MPASYTSGQSSYFRRHSTCCVSSQRSHIVFSTPCYGSGHLLHTWLTCPPSANAWHHKSRHPVYLPHNSSTFHLTTTAYVRRSGQITDGMRNSWITLRDTALSSATTAPTILEWPYQKQLGSGLTDFAPVSDVSALDCTNGVWLLCGLWVWRRRQTVDHVVLQRLICRPPHGLHGLTVLDDETIEWCLNRDERTVIFCDTDPVMIF